MLAWGPSMIFPSIDLQNGHAVQLIGGGEKGAGCRRPRPIAERFGRVGEVAVLILMQRLDGKQPANDSRSSGAGAVPRGGGIRDLETARFWLDAGARKIILGTAAEPELLDQLPRDRVIAALDAVDGECC
ncbi:MAG: hypothetical protein Ct9H300mP16_09560 [Pseudomonadota bacterium]|nr:MAG: hypothetical protein Ct9H300mP16_09560 [Pseudomonadota bacterium]